MLGFKKKSRMDSLKEDFNELLNKKQFNGKHLVAATIGTALYCGVLAEFILQNMVKVGRIAILRR